MADIITLAQRIQALATTKQDFVADTRTMNLTVAQVEEQRIPTLVVESQGAYPLTEYAQQQISIQTGIPKNYFGKMLNQAPDLLEQNVNRWFREEPAQRMVRTLAPNNQRVARAYLSDRYARIDHEDVLAAALEAIQDLGYQPMVKTATVTDQRMYLQIVFPKLEGEIKLNDPVQAGIIISNGEIGNGAIEVAPVVYRLVCLNGMIVPKEIAEGRMRRTHIGKRMELGDVAYAQDTMDADNRATMLKMRDAVRQITSENAFERMMIGLRGLAEGPKIEHPVKAAEQIAKTFALPQQEQHGWLESLIQGGDYSRWGALNALTAQAHKTADEDRKMELEHLGGRVMTLPASDWRRVAEAV